MGSQVAAGSVCSRGAGKPAGATPPSAAHLDVHEPGVPIARLAPRDTDCSRDRRWGSVLGRQARSLRQPRARFHPLRRTSHERRRPMSIAWDVVAALYRRPIHAFARLNANVHFRDFARPLHDAPCFPDRLDMYEWLNREWLHGTAVDYLEFGVFQGESLRAWCRFNPHAESCFFGFDSFEGLPEDWTAAKRAGTFRTEVPSIDDPRCRLVKGLFQDSLYPFLDGFHPRGRLVVHVDSDLYSSALFCLAALDRWLVPGSIVIFDEFYDLENEFDAFCDWSRSFYKKCAAIASTSRTRQVALSVIGRQ